MTQLELDSRARQRKSAFGWFGDVWGGFPALSSCNMGWAARSGRVGLTENVPGMALAAYAERQEDRISQWTVSSRPKLMVSEQGSLKEV